MKNKIIISQNASKQRQNITYMHCQGCFYLVVGFLAMDKLSILMICAPIYYYFFKNTNIQDLKSQQ